MKKNLTAVAFSVFLSLLLPLPSWAETVLEEIKRTGVLKVGVRQDAPPLGYVSTEGKWQGYCLELMNLLGQRVGEQLNLTTPVQVELIPSTLETRETMVVDRTVHVECGPNTITRNPKPGIVYSDQFLTTGVYLLVKPENQEFVIPSSSLQNVTVGVLPASLTEQFIRSRYPLARITEFPGIDGRKNAVEAVMNNNLTAFASDGLLMIGEVLRNPNVNSNDYALVPNEPLTCEFYGMILPQGDTTWLNTVNSLILVQESVEILRQLYGSNSDYLKTTEAALQKCLQ